MSDNTSRLSEKVPDNLLNPDLDTIVVWIDNDGQILRQETAQVKLNNPFEFDVTRFLPNVEPLTLDRFFEAASALIEKAQELEGVKEELRVRLVEEYPPTPIDDLGPTGEVITFKVVKRAPANMSGDGASRPQRKAMYSYDLQSPTEPNKVLIVESRPLDHTVEFSCWSKTNKQANSRAVWLEKLFVVHAWAFEVKGAERFYFQERGPDLTMTAGQQRLCQRPLRFFLRFREFEIKAHPALKTFEFEVSIT